MIKLIKRMKVSQQQGFTLVEVLIALALLGTIGVSTMSALNVSSKVILTAREQTIAESLTRTAIEYVKRAPFDDNGIYTMPQEIFDTDGEKIFDLNEPPYVGEYLVEIEAVGTEPGLQIITVKIYYHDRLVSTTEAYKVNR